MAAKCIARKFPTVIALAAAAPLRVLPSAAGPVSSIWMGMRQTDVKVAVKHFQMRIVRHATHGTAVRLTAVQKGSLIWMVDPSMAVKAPVQVCHMRTAQTALMC